MSVTESIDPSDQPDSAKLQLSPNGGLRHLLTLRGLDKSFLNKLLDQSESYLSPLGEAAIRTDRCKGRTIANLFFEPSTRTRASFELAAKRLGADVLNLDVNTSSRIKGESILDTIYTLQAMQIDVFVVRDAGAGVPAYIANNVAPHISILNAGEADVSHPTQGLLDLLTIRRNKGNFENLKVVIVGDIAHSRVARSAVVGLTTMGVGELHLVSPQTLAPDPATMPGTTISSDLDQSLRGADVVMALRIQRERIDDLQDVLNVEDYVSNYGVSRERMKLAAPDAIVMHPGPMNRGIEIESELADSSQSAITWQVQNGVAVRMAILAAVLESLGAR
jgi:aspartate carbamoyltransferase catalytic subunit